MTFTLLMMPVFAVKFAIVAPIILVTSGRPIFHIDRRVGYRGHAARAKNSPAEPQHASNL